LTLILDRLPVGPAAVVLVPPLLLDLLLPLTVPVFGTAIIPVVLPRPVPGALVVAILLVLPIYAVLLPLPLYLVALPVAPIDIVVSLTVLPIAVVLILANLLIGRALTLSFLLSRPLFCLTLLDFDLTLLLCLALLLLPGFVPALNLLSALLPVIRIALLPLLGLCGHRRRRSSALYRLLLLLSLALLALFTFLLLPLFAPFLSLLLGLLLVLFPTPLRIGVNAQPHKSYARDAQRYS
jgi:hypothetical protein